MQEADRLRHEVDELRDTMFSKSFKPPSAWAEREVKYKMEKRQWEESTKELTGRVAELERENSEYRAAGKAHMWEERIQVGDAVLWGWGVGLLWMGCGRGRSASRAYVFALRI